MQFLSWNVRKSKKSRREEVSDHTGCIYFVFCELIQWAGGIKMIRDSENKWFSDLFPTVIKGFCKFVLVSGEQFCRKIRSIEVYFGLVGEGARPDPLTLLAVHFVNRRPSEQQLLDASRYLRLYRLSQ